MHLLLAQLTLPTRLTLCCVLHHVFVQGLEQALTARWPRVQYRIGIDAKYGLVWSQILPSRIGELIVYFATTNAGMRTVKGVEGQEGQHQTEAALRP